MTAVFGACEKRTMSFRGDLVAGLTVWAVLIPEALAYASIAGVSPVVGLYAAPPALDPLRRVRQLPPSGRRPDVGDGRAVCCGGRRPDDGRTRRRARLHRRARPGDRRARPRRRSAAPRLPRQLHLRAGAQGLHHRSRPHHRHRPGAQAARRREGGRQLLRAALGSGRPISTTSTGEPSPSAWHRWPSCSDYAASHRSCPARWPPSSSASSIVELLDLADKGVEIVGDIASGLPSLGLARRRRLRRLPARRRGGGGHHARRVSPKASAPPRRTRRGSTTRSTRTASSSGSGRPTWAVVCRRAWSSTAASRRRRSTVRPAPARRCPVSSWPCSPWSRCCSSRGCSRACRKPHSPPSSSPP